MHILSKVQRSYKKIINGIGFIPTIISLGIVLMAFILIYVQQTELGKDILSTLNFISFESPETVRALLAALLAGIITLTVFSFSMVMVVVNQSASNYSPKIIEGFINKKVNQVILGIYIGSIIFMIISLIQVGDSKNFGEVPHFNVFTSIILMAACIALFILFIQDISNSVRINNIAERIFVKTRNILLKSKDVHQQLDSKNNQEWFYYKAEESGYFQSLSTQRLLKLLATKNLMLKVIPHYGTYLHKEHHLFCLNKKTSDENFLNIVRSGFNIFSGENVQENYFYGFRQLREVAVKALSPGINDPGIAIICLDYLSELLALYMEFEKKELLINKNSNSGIILKKHNFPLLLNLTISPIESYGKRDYLIISHILTILLNISKYDKSKEYKKILMAHAQSVIDSAEKNVDALLERIYINDVVKELNKSNYFDFKTLDIEVTRSEKSYSN